MKLPPDKGTSDPFTFDGHFWYFDDRHLAQAARNAVIGR